MLTMPQQLKIGEKQETFCIIYTSSTHLINVNVTKCTSNDVENMVKIENSEIICFIKSLDF